MLTHCKREGVGEDQLAGKRFPSGLFTQVWESTAGKTAKTLLFLNDSACNSCCRGGKCTLSVDAVDISGTMDQVPLFMSPKGARTSGDLHSLAHARAVQLPQQHHLSRLQPQNVLLLILISRHP